MKKFEYSKEEVLILKKVLIQGYKQCKNEGDLDTCSFGYEKGVLITGNDAAYILQVLDKIKQLESQVEEKDEWIMSEKTHSEIGSHHRSATLLSYFMRVGEYLSDHGSETKDEHLRGWGKTMNEYAIEVNDFLHTLPDAPKSEKK